MGIGPEILDEIPRFKLVEAIQAAERGDEMCPACHMPVSHPDRADVLAYFAPDVWYYPDLFHHDCRRVMAA